MGRLANRVAIVAGAASQAEGAGWDVAYAALYLASDEARWVTGVMLPIDGGFQNIRPWPR